MNGRRQPPQAQIKYVKRLKPGEIPIDDFKKVADTRPPDALLLDAREQPVEGIPAQRAYAMLTSKGFDRCAGSTW